MAAMVHLICGAIGAGKSTYAATLAAAQRAPVLSIDDWMTTLFGPDMTGPPDWAWVSARVMRCETQILKTALAIGAFGSEVILDIGLLRSHRRREIADQLRASDRDVTLHVLDVDADERWRRVDARNRERGATYSLTVSRQMFDFVETLWQPPDDGELAALNGWRVG